MYKILCALLLACLLSAEARYTLPVKIEQSQNVPNTKAENKISYRLPDSVEPISYKIDLTVYLDENEPNNFTFSGSVNIVLNVKKPTKSIILHSQDLTITALKMFKKFPSEVEVTSTSENATNFLIITQKQSDDFKAGEYNLLITYKGKLNDDLRGFYRSHYMNGDKKVWLATTHFEPVGARRAIPCFDEPAYKATFEMTITHNKKYKAIFNTKTKSSNPDAGETVKTEFEKTPLMSTYLLAFVVSDFESLQNNKKDVTVFARPDAKQFGQLAVDKGEQILKKLENYTKIPFEIGKMDQIAIPQFLAGAMENWGLVTYSEQYLLHNKENSTTAEMQTIVETIAHEFAHQWFGDLVSPQWWKYLWLNEGFANFFQSYITEQVENSWRSVEQSVVNSGAFVVDSSNNTHPINHDVESPEEISKIFDTITYQKGGAVIRMMQHYLTDEIFKKGLQRYLTDFKHKAANSDDLFKSIQTVVDAEKRNIKVKEVMDTWVNKKGYPVVTVIRDYNNKTMNLTQERFFTYNASTEERKDNLWQIPISYATEKNVDFNNTSANILFEKTTEIVPVDDAEKNHWIILNKQQTGFYRVNYDKENWKLIINYLNSPNREKIHPLNRAQLINDALAFVKEEILELQTLLQLTDTLKNETDYIAWTPAFNAFSYLKSKLINTEFYPFFKEYVINAMAALVKSVGLKPVENDDHIKKLNRIPAMSLACALGHSECLKNMNEILVQWLKNETTPISKDLKYITFCNGLRNSSNEIWHEVFNKCKTHPDVSEQKIMIRALTCSSEKKNIDYYLSDSLTNSDEQHIQSTIVNILSNSEVGVDAVLYFMSQNIFMIHWQLNSKEKLIELINLLGAKITTETQLSKLKDLKNLNVKLPEELTTEAIRIAEENLSWLKKNNATLTAQFIKSSEDKNSVGTVSTSVGLIASLLIILFYNNL